MGGIGSCTICQRADVRSVDAQLREGGGYRTVARIVGVPHVTLREHWIRCRKKGEVDYQPGDAAQAVPAVPSSAVMAMPALPSGHLDLDPIVGAIEQIRQAHEKALKAYDDASAAGDMRAIALLLPQLRQNLEMRLKLMKVSPDAGERLKDNPDWAKTRRAILETLDEYPDAREAIRAALVRTNAMEG